MPKRFGYLVAVFWILSGCTSISDYSDKVFNKYYDKIFASAPVVKPAKLVKFTETAKTRVLWHADIGDAGSYIFSPLVIDNVAYFANARGQITRYDLVTGKQTQRFDAGTRLSGGVGGSADLIVVGTPQGEVLAFDHNGKRLWETPLRSEILSAPRVDEGRVVVRGGDDRIFGLDAATGALQWTYQRLIPTLTMRTNASVVLYRGGVFVGFPDGRLAVLNLQNGGIGWEAQVAMPKGSTELERVTDIASEPVIDGRQICAVAFQGRVGCFDLLSGAPQWGQDLSSVAGLTIANETLYVADEKSDVLAFDEITGASQWKQDKLYGRQITAPVALGSFVAVGDYQGYVHFLNRKDGALAARLATDGAPIVVAPIPLDNGILVVTQKGDVYVIAIQ